MPVIVFPDDYPPILVGTDEEKRLRKLGEVRIYESEAVGEEELISRVADADIAYIMRSSSVFTRNVMQHCPKLKLISILGAGYDHIDIKAASEFGITVCTTPSYASVAVAELAISLMLDIAHCITWKDNEMRSGRWAHEYASQLCGKTLGVIGTGSISQKVIQLAKAIGMNVVAWTFHPSPERAEKYGVKFVSLEELLQQSDVISLHVRSTPETKALIGKHEFSLMKSTAILVNTARGALVDEDALIEVLNNGRIAGAGLDVFVTEPLPVDHPLRKIKNTVLSPHEGWMVPEATYTGMVMAVDNVENFLRGHPINVISEQGSQ